MSTRDWLLIIGGLLIIGVLAHGAWVYWRQRRVASFSYERDVPDMEVDDLDLLRSELPSGGARRVGELEADGVPARGAVTPTGGARRREPSPGREPIIPVSRYRRTQAAGLAGGSDDADSGTAESEVEVSGGPGIDGDSDSQVAAASERRRVDDAPLRASRDEPDPEPPPLSADGPMVGGRPRRAAQAPADDAASESGAASGVERSAPTSAPAGDDGADELDFEDILVINVLCRDGGRMPGPALLDVVTEAGMQFGDMNIFHRHGSAGRAEYSMASAVKPGTFDLAEIDDFTTPGVSFFMRLPGPDEPLQAFDEMAEVATALADRMGAELKDERHSVMTGQTLEHCRQRIREFRRRQMSRRD